MPTLEDLNVRFSADRFATEAAGAKILEAEEGHALCAMDLLPIHLNAAGRPMGGAVFTLADFAFAVAANGFSDRVTVSQQTSITFLSPGKGHRFLAEARCLRAGRTTCLYTVEVRDEVGTKVAFVTINGYTLPSR